jgi:hypothetical protein
VAQQLAQKQANFFLPDIVEAWAVQTIHSAGRQSEISTPNGSVADEAGPFVGPAPGH